MRKATRKATLVISSLLMLFQNSCGDNSPSEGRGFLIAEEADRSTSEAPAADITQTVGVEHCSEEVPLDDRPATFCKDLSDGSVYAVTLKPSKYIQDPETCVITVVDDGIKAVLLEMEFELCDE